LSDLSLHYRSGGRRTNHNNNNNNNNVLKLTRKEELQLKLHKILESEQQLQNSLQTIALSNTTNKQTSATLFIAVFSQLDNTVARMTIRSTYWCPILQDDSVILRFIIGDPKFSNNSKIQSEMREYNDLIVINTTDSQQTLAYRMRCTIQIAETFFNFTYFLKTTDSTYLRVHSLLRLLPELPKEKLYWGPFSSDKKLPNNPRNRWYNEEYLHIYSQYPTYAVNNYLITRDIIHWVTSSPIPIKVWENAREDSQLGAWMLPLDISRFDSSELFWFLRCQECNCRENLIAVSGLDPDMMADCFEYDVVYNDVCSCPVIVARQQEREYELERIRLYEQEKANRNHNRNANENKNIDNQEIATLKLPVAAGRRQRASRSNQSAFITIISMLGFVICATVLLLCFALNTACARNQKPSPRITTQEE